MVIVIIYSSSCCSSYLIFVVEVNGYQQMFIFRLKYLCEGEILAQSFTHYKIVILLL